MVTVHTRIGILAAVLLAGCASSRPAAIADSRLDVAAIAHALAEALTAEIQQGRVTFRLDSAELLSGRSRCGTDRLVHCDPDQHRALLNALSRELNAEIVAHGEAMFCPQKRLPCLPSGEVTLVKVALPVVDSSGVTQVDVSMSIATDESEHPKIFSVFLRCGAGQCAVVGRQSHQIG